MANKRGLEMAITTIMMIILSITLLTILMIYANSQTGIFNRFIKTHSDESTVDIFVSSCNTLVDRDASYSYCCEKKEVVLGGSGGSTMSTCVGAKELNWSSSRISSLDCSNVVCSG